jgi:hypothetical protein
MTTDYLFDSTLLIDLLRDDARAESYLAGLPDDTGLFTHALVKAEVLVGLRNTKELGKFDRLFRKFELLHAHEADSAAALARPTPPPRWHRCVD